MRLDTVESTMLHAIGYDEDMHILEVIYNTGGIYFYRDVPRDVYEGLIQADSKGQYFLETVRDRYPYWTLEDWQRAQRMEQQTTQKKSDAA